MDTTFKRDQFGILIYIIYTTTIRQGEIKDEDNKTGGNQR